MNDQAIIGYLALAVYILVKDVLPRITGKKNGHSGDETGLQQKLETLEEEVDKLRQWRHKMSTVITLLVADYEVRTGREMDLP